MSFHHNDVASTIDRMINATTTTTTTSTTNVAPASSFIPSTRWQGSMEGYYFGTSDQGTGYYLDDKYENGTATTKRVKRARFDNDDDQDGSTNNTSTKRKVVHFGQDQIQTFEKDDDIHYENNDYVKKLTPQQLLEEAEAQQKSSTTKTLDLSHGPSSIKSTILTLEKCISKNQLLRVEYPDDPSKFMNSEVALYEEIEVWNDLAASIEYYELFIEMGAVDSLKGLLIHDNVDIVLGVIRLFKELLDPEMLGNTDDDVNMIGEQLCKLLMSFLGWMDVNREENDDGTKLSNLNGSSENESNGLDMVIANLARLNDSEEEELKGVDDILTLIENILDLDQLGVLKLARLTTSTAEEDSDNDNGIENRGQKTIVEHLTKRTTFTSYLLMKLSNRKLEDWTTTMKLHASEVLATIIQHENSRITLSNISMLKPYKSIFDDDREGHTNHKKSTGVFDGMEGLLQAIAAYRKKDPLSDEECEYLENICNTLSASLLNEENLKEFLDRQGIELMLRCVNEHVHAGFGAMKILFFSLSGSSKVYKNAAETFVDAGGLKTIFPIFMGRKSSMPKPATCSDAGNVKLLRKYAELQIENRRKGENEQQKKPSRRMKEVLAANREWFHTLEAHSIQILYGLTRYLDDSSPHDAKSRLASKFIENEFEKCDRLVELCLKYDVKMRQAEYDYYRSDEAEEAEESGVDIDIAAMNFKLKAGGDLFHRLAAMIGFATTKSKRSHQHILEQLRIQKAGIATVKAAIDEFASIIADESDQKQQLLNYLAAL